MYLTRDQLRRIVDSMPPQAVTEQHVFSSLGADSTVFLSHKHQEREILFQVKALLESLGMNVYIDWMERNMQHPTNAETAKELKRQIDEQDKFILIATDAAISAPWCNWEIGLADRSKSDQDKIAILPIADTSGRWNHNEYLRIYPSIEYQDGMSKNTRNEIIAKGYYVLYPANTEGNRKYISLNEWLKQGMPQGRFL